MNTSTEPLQQRVSSHCLVERCRAHAANELGACGALERLPRRARDRWDGYLFANDLNTSRRLETLGSMLADKGHSAARIEKILGRNLLRVFAETWSAWSAVTG